MIVYYHHEVHQYSVCAVWQRACWWPVVATCNTKKGRLVKPSCKSAPTHKHRHRTNTHTHLVAHPAHEFHDRMMIMT